MFGMQHGSVRRIQMTCEERDRCDVLNRYASSQVHPLPPPPPPLLLPPPHPHATLHAVVAVMGYVT